MPSDITELTSDAETLQVLGTRLKAQRIAAQLTQAALAARAGIGRATVERIEAGRGCELPVLIRVLRELRLSAGLNALVPELPPSPLEALKRRGTQRQRVRSPTRQVTPPTPFRWGEDS